MKNTLINTDQRTFLVKFKYQSTEGCFIVQGCGLVECLKTKDKNGIKLIKEFDPSKEKFIRISKPNLLANFSWNTESYLYLQSHYYFK